MRLVKRINVVVICHKTYCVLLGRTGRDRLGRQRRRPTKGRLEPVAQPHVPRAELRLVARSNDSYKNIAQDEGNFWLPGRPVEAGSITREIVDFKGESFIERIH